MAGLAFDLLVRNRVPGVGFVLFFMLGCLSVPVVRRPARPETYALLAGAFSLAAWTMIRDADFLVAFDIGAAVVLASLAVSAEVYDLRVWMWRVRDHFSSWFSQLGSMFGGAATALRALLNDRDRVRIDRAVPYLRGVAIAIPVFLVFALLLSAADAVFSDFLGGAVPDWDFELGATVEHLIWIVIAAWAAAGLLTFVVQPDRRRAGEGSPAGREAPAGAPRKRPQESGVDTDSGSSRQRVGYVEAMIVLSSVTSLIALFVVFQFAYLFGGEAQIDLPGMTYAEYAREGFFQLLAVAALVVALVWTAIVVAGEEESPRRNSAFRIACTLMIVLTAVVLVSALKRLGLYEDAYGLTRLRLLSQVFIFWLAGVLALLLAQVYWTLRHIFVAGIVVTAFLSWTAVNALNPDARIARRNLDMAAAQARGASASEREEAITTQLEYIVGLGADAIPEVAGRIEFGSVDPGGAADEVGYWFCSELDRGQSWREWNLGRERARDSVAALKVGDGCTADRTGQ
ncbi:MAG: DUF4173 domain-containing protein [Actinobacteria bacterium]|nr:DUF4173 domain-containing protein [Actinomycetota bacterium]